MAAPKGNQFWKIRSKHGRDKLFKSKTLLWNAAKEYFQWCDDNPWAKTEVKGARGSDGQKIGMTETKDQPTARPYTLTGLCIYLGCSSSYFRVFRKTIEDKDKPTKKDQGFLTVIETIEEVIYTQKFEGAAVGAFNANIISRDLGLADKKEIIGDIAPTMKITIVKNTDDTDEPGE